MARKKKSRRRSRKSFSLINALESLTYAEIISRGTTGGGVWSFITGAGDIEMSGGTSVTDLGLGVSSMVGAGWKGTDQISLQDMMMEPGVAVSHMANNFQSNLIPMAASAFGVSVGFRIGKRLLRAPLNNINRNLVKPALGSGIKL
ncbi:MAG: hypothetical protein [Bacteriophage sp.]|nr:MAG: hypothetical protein [Bacteriophage sp.]